jgi:ribose transport system permease protein
VPHSAETSHAAISDVASIKEQTLLQRVLASQPFWVAVALVILVTVMSSMEPSFGTSDNAANVTRNFAPFGIMALGMTVVIITGGIDLSVGSVMGLVAIVAGLFLTWEYPWYVAFAMGLLSGLVCGAVNGLFVAYVGMPSFVVTLGMLLRASTSARRKPPTPVSPSRNRAIKIKGWAGIPAPSIVSKTLSGMCSS